ncbi:hypothetical protein ACFWQK_11080 [Brachybacterium paraconglomeratum]
MTTKTKKTTSAHEQAITETTERVTDLEALVDALTEELAELRSERDALQDKHDHGYDLDLDRLGDLTETIIPRREARLEVLTTETLPEAKQAAERAVLLELAERDADGIPGKYAAYLQAVADAEEKVAQALADARVAAEEWNGFIEEVSRRAQAAGLSDSLSHDDHPIRYKSRARLGYQPESAPEPEVIYGGETYQGAGSDATVRKVARKADGHLNGLIVAAHEADIVAEGRRLQRLTSRR